MLYKVVQTRVFFFHLLRVLTASRRTLGEQEEDYEEEDDEEVDEELEEGDYDDDDDLEDDEGILIHELHKQN